MLKQQEAKALGEIGLNQIKGSKNKKADTSKKGFLEKRGYIPENLKKRELEKEITPDIKLRESEDISYTTETTKRARPEPDEKKKKLKGMPQKVSRSLWHKEQSIRKYLIIRYSLVGAAIFILIISLIFSYLNYLSWSESESSLEKKGYEFRNDLIGYQDLAMDNEYSAYTWDNNKFLRITSDDIKNDLSTEFEFIVEVHDLSNYTTKYDRTLLNELAWSSETNPSTAAEEDGNSFKISTYVNIFVSPDEVHFAKIEIIIWE
jgi:hypothetical protein